jgi:protease II
MRKALIFLVVLAVLVASVIVVFKKISDETLIRITKTDSLNSILNEPSKIFFVTNDGIYASDKDGNRTERVAIINSKLSTQLHGVYNVKISGISPDSKWLVLSFDPLYDSTESKRFLYALNIQTLKLVKVEESYSGKSILFSFDCGDDKLLIGIRGLNNFFNRVYCLDLNTGKVSNLLDSSKNSGEKAYSFDISPDGKYIVYAGGNVDVFPNNRIALYIKNLKTGEVKILAKPQNKDQNSILDYIQKVMFINSGKEILYLREIEKQDGEQTAKWYIVDLQGKSKEIPGEEAIKFINKEEELRQILIKALNKSVSVKGVLDKCKKIVFSTLENEEKLYICNDNLSNIVFTGITNPNFMHFSPDSCKFTCEVLSHNDTSIAPTSIWYLIDATTNKKVNLNELFKVEVKDAIYIGE